MEPHFTSLEHVLILDLGWLAWSWKRVNKKADNVSGVKLFSENKFFFAKFNEDNDLDNTLG